MTDQITPQKSGLLPGIIAIAAFMLLMSVASFYSGMRFAFGKQRIIVFAFTVLFAAAGLGLLRLKRWGWAMSLAAAFLAMSIYVWFFLHGHQPQQLVMAAANLVFFLYLMRDDVRMRLR
jgi:uncharacterized membrane protein (DUF2068 family)